MSNEITNSLEKKTWHKILASGASCHGGDMKWSLPVGGKPGEWHEVSGELKMCRNGLHLTDQPSKWWREGCAIFAAEVEGVAEYNDSDAKCVARRARLTKELSEDELREVLIFTSGKHQINTGHACASGSATVEAYNSATVRAYNSATVEASGSATVEAYNSATVEAYNSATVRAYNSATVRAYNSATVEASDSATVEAFGSATVISPRSSKALVQLKNKAVHVDRRNGQPKIYVLDGDAA